MVPQCQRRFNCYIKWTRMPMHCSSTGMVNKGHFRMRQPVLAGLHRGTRRKCFHHCTKWETSLSTQLWKWTNLSLTWNQQDSANIRRFPVIKEEAKPGTTAQLGSSYVRNAKKLDWTVKRHIVIFQFQNKVPLSSPLSSPTGSLLVKPSHRTSVLRESESEKCTFVLGSWWTWWSAVVVNETWGCVPKPTLTY